MKHKLYALVGVLLITLLSFATLGCQTANNTTTAAPQKVSLGLLRLTSSAPLFIAMEKGYFKEEGLDVQAEWFEAAQPIAVATASNKVDVGATGITAGLYNMVAQGQKLTIVADKGREEKGITSTALMVTTDNFNQGITSVPALKGKKIGITQSGSTFEYMIGRLLELNGLTKKDVELVSLGKVSSILAALESKQIDAAIVNQPHIAKAEKANYAKVIQPIGDAMTYQTSGIFYSPSFSQNEKLSLAFMKAYIKATRYYNDAVLGKEKGPHYEEVIGIIAKYTNTPADIVAQGLPYIDKNGELLDTDIQQQLDWYAKESLIVKPIKASEVVNKSFWEKALKSLP